MAAPMPADSPALPPVTIPYQRSHVTSDVASGTPTFNNTVSTGAAPVSNPPSVSAPAPIPGPALPAPVPSSISTPTPLPAVHAGQQLLPPLQPPQTPYKNPTPIFRVVPQAPQFQHSPSPPLQRVPSMPNGRIAIVEPPSKARASPGSSNNATVFKSPTANHAQSYPKFSEDSARLDNAIRQSLPEAVRQAVRDQWEKTILGTEFHQAFILNAVVNRSSGVIIRRAIKEFGRKMVLDSKHQLIEHFESQDLDDVVDVLLDKASDDFLDKAMERRLATIDARSLINALARAERLGYETKDVLGSGNATAPAYPPQQQQSFQPVPQPPPPSLPQPQQQNFEPGVPQRTASTHQRPHAQPPQIPQCPLCWRNFTSTTAYEYHVKKQVCTRAPPNAEGFQFSCSNCGAGFTTSVGRQYHLDNKVCEAHSTASATPKALGEQGSSPHNSQPPAASTGSAAATSTQPPTRAELLATRQLGGPGTPLGMAYPPGEADPYVHLNAATRARLEDDLRQVEIAYAPKFREAEAIADPELRRQRMDAVQNSFSTKQSITRKRYGVRLRHRRTKEEIDAERIRLHGTPDLPNKRQRIDDGRRGSPAYVASQYIPAAISTPPAYVPQSASVAPPASMTHLSVSEMGAAGLSGASATAAMTDPTLAVGRPASPPPPQSQPPRNSLSSYQRGGYRVDTHHVSRPATQSPTDGNASSARSSITADSGTKTQSPQQPPAQLQQQPPAQKRGSKAEPVVINDDDAGSSSDSDDDSDEDIPATLPPGRKASGTQHGSGM